MPLHVPPDTTKILIDFLAQQPDVTALCAPVNDRPSISTDLPHEFPATHITVQQINTGGYRDRAAWSLDTHHDVNVWALDEASANLLARTALAAIAQQLVGYRHREGVVTDVADLGGPGWFPDTTETPPIPRFIFSISITAHP